jgi:hypothetical protein
MEKVLEESCVAHVGAIRGEEDVAEDGYDADRGGNGKLRIMRRVNALGSLHAYGKGRTGRKARG